MAKSIPLTPGSQINQETKEVGQEKENCLERGRALWQDGRIVSAINEWKKAVHLDQNYCDAWLSLATAYHELHQNLDALVCYKNALACGKDRVAEKDVAGKIKELESASREDESDPLWEKTRFFIKSAKLVTGPDSSLNSSPASDVAQASGQPKSRDRDAVDVPSPAPKSADYEHPLEIYQKAVAQEPNNLANYMNLAIAYELIGKYQDAITQYQHVTRLDPKNVDAMVAIGDIYSISLSDDKTALYWYAKAIKNTSDTTKKKAIAYRIGKFMLGARER